MSLTTTSLERATILEPATPQDMVRVDLGDRGYEIRIGSGLLAEPASFDGLPASHVGFIVTNSTVAPLYLESLRAAIAPRHVSIDVVTLPDGESTKTWASLDAIFDALLSAACDRKTVIYALGGGVIGDLAGFAAACYLRGVPFVQVPTTLLAQVDSSVGGKTAINHPLGKNMIGAFYQPLRVVADLATLQTLPRRELQAGLAEVIKYGPIADMAFFEWLERHLDELLAGDPQALLHAVKRSCEIKAQVVGSDERESGLRAILNFGHTFGHAIEAGLGYGVWLHGEAVACGMVMAADLSQRLGLVESGLVERLVRLIERAGLPTVGPALGVDRYLEAMSIDKKTEAGQLRFVLLDGAGRACVRGAPTGLVREVIEARSS